MDSVATPPLAALAQAARPEQEYTLATQRGESGLASHPVLGQATPWEPRGAPAPLTSLQHGTASLDAVLLEEIYKEPVRAQNALVEVANKLCKKRKLEGLGLAAVETWAEVENSLDTARVAIEQLADKSSVVPPGFAGKMKTAFRALCNNAGVGKTLVRVIPTDSYLSVLGGGLGIIFAALETTVHYRQEILDAVENIPFVMSDSTARLRERFDDEELHRRAAALYQSLFELMATILAWFIKPSIATGARLITDPTGFPQKLKDCSKKVERLAKRVDDHYSLLSDKRVQQTLGLLGEGVAHLVHQNLHAQHGMLYLHREVSQQNAQILGSVERAGQNLSDQNSHVSGSIRGMHQDLHQDLLREFLQSSTRAQTYYTYTHKPPPRQLLALPPTVSGEMVNKFLIDHLYDSELAPEDAAAVRASIRRPGCDVDEDRLGEIRSDRRLSQWLAGDEAGMLLVDADSWRRPAAVDMSVASAEAVIRVAEARARQLESDPRGRAGQVVLSFFCSRHRHVADDPNAAPSEMAMSLLLQLVDGYREFDAEAWQGAVGRLDPEDAASACSVLGDLLRQLPAEVTVLLVIDGLKHWKEPPERLHGAAYIVGYLVRIHRHGGCAATLKFLFSSATRLDFVELLFLPQERLKILQR